jgi:hypothetical protein
VLRPAPHLAVIREFIKKLIKPKMQRAQEFLSPKVEWTRSNLPQIIDDILHSSLFQIFLGCILFVLACVKAVSKSVALAIALAWFVTIYGVTRYERLRKLSAKKRLAITFLCSVGLFFLAVSFYRWAKSQLPSFSPSSVPIQQPPLSREPPGTMSQGPPESQKIMKTHAPQEAPKPNVSLRFVSPTSPVLVFENPSDAVAHDVKWAVALWNIDLPDRNDPLPIPSNTVDWIKAHDEVGPAGLFGLSTVAPLLKPGNRLFGSAMVDCPACSRGRTYILYIVCGESGWYSEIKWNHPGKLIVPPNFMRVTREAYFKLLEDMAPPSTRTPIGNWP